MLGVIKYKKGYKYQLTEDCIVETYICPPYNKNIVIEYLELHYTGRLTIYKGYAWDGPSGLTIDTKTFMRGSLIHDALYQLLRMGLLSGEFRQEADSLLKKICLEDGMSRVRANYVYACVRLFGGPAASMEHIKKTYSAPYK